MISNRYIDWKAFTPSYVESEMPKLIAEASEALEKIENGEISTYEDLVYALNDATFKLWRMWGALSHLLSVMNSKEWREIQEKFQGEIVAFSLRVEEFRTQTSNSASNFHSEIVWNCFPKNLIL